MRMMRMMMTMIIIGHGTVAATSRRAVRVGRGGGGLVSVQTRHVGTVGTGRLGLDDVLRERVIAGGGGQDGHVLGMLTIMIIGMILIDAVPFGSNQASLSTDIRSGSTAGAGATASSS